MAAQQKSMPKDGHVMVAILKEIGITEYEPRVINQMLEFTYRYVTSILDDAQLFCKHANKKSIDIDDVRLAITIQKDKYFTSPPLREVLVDIATQKNNTPLPLIKSTAGPRLPPDRYSLTGCNYRLKFPSKRQRILPPMARASIASLQQSSVNKHNPQVAMVNKNSGIVSTLTKAGIPAVLPRTIINPTLPKNYAPTPVFNYPEGNRSSTPSIVKTVVAGPVPSPNMPSKIVMREPQSVPECAEKRKREDDQDNYDA